MTATMSFNFCASNNAGDYSTGGIFNPNDFVIRPSQDPNISWFIQGPVSMPESPIVGSLRISPVSGMIEMWDGLIWTEYGKPLVNPPFIVTDPPKVEDDDFELGGAL